MAHPGCPGSSLPINRSISHHLRLGFCFVVSLAYAIPGERVCQLDHPFAWFRIPSSCVRFIIWARSVCCLLVHLFLLVLWFACRLKVVVGTTRTTQIGGGVTFTKAQPLVVRPGCMGLHTWHTTLWVVIRDVRRGPYPTPYPISD
jgi:hypothetical protein